MNRWGILPFRKNRDHLLGEILRKNPRMIGEPIYQQELDARAEQILKNYALGRLIVAGDNRFLSGDLLDFVKPAGQGLFLHGCLLIRLEDQL